MHITIIGSLTEVNAVEWNALVHADNPFARHEFLIAMERHDAVGKTFGWYPQYLIARDNDELVGAVPMYLKDNSYGELVFDWAWADAYQRNGLAYYPKLVIAIPYTPATGPRLLAAENRDRSAIKQRLIQAVVDTADHDHMSSAHWLFCMDEDQRLLQQSGMLMRSDFQYHWSNDHYDNFDHFLSYLSSKKRKNIRRERRKVAQARITTEVIDGEDLSEEQWHIL